jgi:CheY-like chemotaxis protein
MKTAAGKARLSKIVLIVDDNPALRKIVRERFLSDGFDVCAEAGSGREAIDIAAQIKPRLIILDLSMPIMNGLEAAPILKDLLPDTKIILFTQFGDHLKHITPPLKGVSAIVAKNSPLDELIRQAHEILEDK